MGFKSPSIPLGLSSNSTVVPQAGFRSPLPFWNAGTTVVPIVDVELPANYTHDRFRHQQILQEDEELLIIGRAFIEIIRCR